MADKSRFEPLEDDYNPMIGSTWIYIKPGEGVGTRHKVILCDQHEVITSSWIGDPERTRVAYGWCGPREMFADQFSLP